MMEVRKQIEEGRLPGTRFQLPSGHRTLEISLASTFCVPLPEICTLHSAF
jgi:hypothetical protein